jgi:3D (Asp-Asp-Asp) domain-containing protein
MVATAYPAMVTGSGRTRLGYRADYGHVAVDPRVIPLGSLVYVEGYGFALASDTGSAIKGNRIDLCYPDWGTADRYGVKKVTVHVFNR